MTESPAGKGRPTPKRKEKGAPPPLSSLPDLIRQSIPCGGGTLQRNGMDAMVKPWHDDNSEIPERPSMLDIVKGVEDQQGFLKPLGRHGRQCGVVQQFEQQNPRYKVIVSASAERDTTRDSQRLLCAIAGEVPR